MTSTSSLDDQEFVAHLFAPLDGPNAVEARHQIRTLWNNCRTQLGMTQPIVDAGLLAELPEDLSGGPDGPLAGIQDPTAQYQAIVRREHDVLNLSLAIATPASAPGYRPRIGDSAPAGWYEFTRWWRKLSISGVGALLGSVTVHLAKTGDAAAADVRHALPTSDEDADGWWNCPLAMADFAVWEVTPPSREPGRRLVVLGRPDEEVRLSSFAWSAGDPALPPLARYLMHVAKLRYLARVRGDGQTMAVVRDRATARLDRLTRLMREPAEAHRVAGEASALAADEAALAAIQQELRRMRRSVEIARANMVKAVPVPLPADAALADWLADQLMDDADYLEAALDRAERIRLLLGTAVVRPGPAPVLVPPPPEPAPSPDVRVEHRIGFGVDVVSYSSRTAPQQRAVQARLSGMVHGVLAAIGLDLHDTDRQDAGDGMTVVLPSQAESHEVLPKLLHGWRKQVMTDNAAHPEDRIRLRLSIGSGPFTAAAIGFSGNTIIEIGRLLDSDALRRAVTEHPDTDLVALVSERLHQDVVGEGYPDLSPNEFEQLRVEVKSYRRSAWLWTGGPGTARVAEPGPAGRPAPDRRVFIIHGPDEQARMAMAGLLRALDLRPVNGEEVVVAAGPPEPDPTFEADSAALVLLTPRDTEAGGSGVLLRAGMALARQPERTVIVQIGPVGPVDGLDGANTVRIQQDTEAERAIFVQRVAQRLRTAGYPVNTEGTDWLDTERFAGLAAYRRAR